MLAQKTATEADVAKTLAEQEVRTLKTRMEEECHKALKEKEALVRRLEELSIELKDREVAAAIQEDQLQASTKFKHCFMPFIIYLS